MEAEEGDPNWSHKRAPILKVIYDSLEKFSGSISAEHGIGQLKTNQLINTKDPNHYHIMTKIKSSLDPKNLLNPGRIIN